MRFTAAVNGWGNEDLPTDACYSLIISHFNEVLRQRGSSIGSKHCRNENFVCKRMITMLIYWLIGILEL